jgi:hypothetical protein
MGLQTTCEACGQTCLGVFSALRKVDGRYLCKVCVSNPDAVDRYYCPTCAHFSPTARMKGNGWIELVLYLCYVIPGVIYSIWRRSGPRTVCALCSTTGAIPAALVKRP